MVERLACPYCDKYDRKTFLKLKVCPKCGSDLAARVSERERAPAFRRDEAFVAHRSEVEYAHTAVVQRDEPVEHDASQLLDYAIGLLDLTRLALEASADAAALVLGFLTGSASLSWLLRRRYGRRLESRVRFAPGLRTPRATTDLEAILDSAYASGRSHVVVIDEVVSGSQMRTNLAAIDAWAVSRGYDDHLKVDLLGVREAGSELSDDEVRIRILRDSKKHKFSLKGVSASFVTVPKLLAMDSEGRPLKGVWGGGGVPYAADRIWPGGYRVRCRNRIAFEGCADLDVAWSDASLDQVFGELVWRICGFSPENERVWPGTVLRRGCADCRERLIRAREIAAKLPPLPPENDPRAAFDRLFGETGTAPEEVQRLRRQRKSVLDAVLDQFGALDRKLGTDDKRKVDAHLSLVRDLEQRIVVNGPTCTPPAEPAQLPVDSETTMPTIMRLQMDILAVALSCDLTRVASVQCSNAENHIAMPWIDSRGDGHSLSHAGPSSPAEAAELTKRDTWYAGELAYLLGRLDSVMESGRSVLDNSIVFWGNELSVGATHSHIDMPFVIAGGAGYFRMGRYLRYDHASHVNMLLSFLHAMDIDDQTFGDPEFCEGPLSGLR